MKTRSEKISILNSWQRPQLWLPLIKRNMYAKSRLFQWHLSLGSSRVQRILFLGLRHWSRRMVCCQETHLRLEKKWNSSWVCCILSSHLPSIAYSEGCLKITPFNTVSPLILPSLMSLICCSLTSLLWLAFPCCCFCWSGSFPAGTPESRPRSLLPWRTHLSSRLRNYVQLDWQIRFASPDLFWQSC